jgi:hypothetical protein
MIFEWIYVEVIPNKNIRFYDFDEELLEYIINT